MGRRYRQFFIDSSLLVCIFNTADEHTMGQARGPICLAVKLDLIKHKISRNVTFDVKNGATRESSKENSQSVFPHSNIKALKRHNRFYR